MTKNYNDLVLNKHVGTIHCSNNMTLLQRKIFNVLLHNAYDRLLIEDFHYIPYKRLSDLIGYNSRDLMTLKKAIRALESTVVECNILKPADIVNQNHDDIDEGEIWVSSSLLASVMIDTKNKICRYEYSRALKQMLHQPEVYARINLAVQAKFKSAYGLALYENCIRFKNVRSTGWIDIGIFKKLMGVTDDQYTIYRDFNRRVLVPAVREVNAYSDVTLATEIRRVDQKVKALRFAINIKYISSGASNVVVKNNFLALNDELESQTKKTLTNYFKLKDSEILQLISEFGSELLTEKVTVIMQSYQPDKINHPIKLLRAALKNDYQVSNFKEIHTSEGKQTTKQKTNLLEESGYKDQYAEYLASEIFNLFINMDAVAKEHDIDLFLKYSQKLNWQVVIDTRTQFPIEKWLKVNKESFTEFYLQTYPQVKSRWLSFNDFIKRIKN